MERGRENHSLSFTGMRLAWALLFCCAVCFLAPGATGSSRNRLISNPATGTAATVEYTEQGVPFITATNENDLFFAQGLVVSELRLWQMDIYRRAGRGQVAEIWPAAIDVDIQARRLQWVQVCEENIRNSPQEYLDRIQYYINGVNAYVQKVTEDPTLLPPEYARYGVPAPSPYTILDTFLLVKVLATGLSGDARAEPRNQEMLSKLGSQRFEQFFSRDPAMPFIAPPNSHSNYSRASPSNVRKGRAAIRPCDTLKEQKSLLKRFFQDDEALPSTIHLTHQEKETMQEWLPFSGKNYKKEEYLKGDLGDFLQAFPPQELTRASNSWAVSGKHTTSGLPIFSNDPHLPYTAPIIWVIVGLHLDAPNSRWNHVVGATLVLCPGVGIGRNQNVSWGYTMVQSDTQDLFVMKNLPGNDQYMYKGKPQSYQITSTLISIKNAAPLNLTLYRSVYGPVIPTSSGIFYSLAWTAQGPKETSVEAIMDQCMASNVEQYIAAVGKWWSLSFNAVYADTLGNIGYHASGAIPQRPAGDQGLLPKPGDGSQDWLGIIPFGELFNFVNPEQGFIVTANNPTAPYGEQVNPIYGNFAPGFRAQRVIDMITDQMNQGKKLDADYMSSIQGSEVDLLFSYLFPSVQGLQLS